MFQLPFLSFALVSEAFIMVPEKQPTAASAAAAKAREKSRQASLLEPQEDKPDNIDKLVAQAFDSDPKVRLRIAQTIGNVDDPRVIFALIELSADKDEQVKETAQRALGHFKAEQAEIVSLEKLLSERKAPPQQFASSSASAPAQPADSRQNMMPTIEKLFAHYEPKRRESVKRKLLPSLQKLFGFKPEELDPLRGLDKISGTSPGQVASAPLQIIAEKDDKSIPSENAKNFPFGKHDEGAHAPRPREEPQYEVQAEKDDLVSIEEEGSQLVGSLEQEEEEVSHDAEEYAVRHKNLFELAYQLSTTPGMGKSELKREQNRMLTSFKKEVEAAFKLAAIKASEDGLATLYNLKPGMKNLSFAPMQISAISEVAYGLRRKPYSRITLYDGKKEISLLVPRERSGGITVSDRIAPKKVVVDFIVEKNEVVLLATNKSSIVIYK